MANATALAISEDGEKLFVFYGVVTPRRPSRPAASQSSTPTSSNGQDGDEITDVFDIGDHYLGQMAISPDGSKLYGVGLKYSETGTTECPVRQAHCHRYGHRRRQPASGRPGDLGRTSPMATGCMSPTYSQAISAL